MTNKPTRPVKEVAHDHETAPHDSGDDAGTNAVEHEPDSQAQPLPDGHHKFIPKSPYRAGN